MFHAGWMLACLDESEGVVKPKRLDDPDLSLENLIGEWPETAAVFLRHDMLCVGCLVNPFHSVKDACDEYDLNVETFYDELREAVKPLR